MRDSATDYRSSKRRMLLALGALLLAAAAFFIGRSTAPDVSESVQPPHPSGDSPSAPQRDEVGAIQAATEFARVMASASEPSSEYLAQAASIAAPEWQTRAQELAQGTIDFVSERYGEGGGVQFAPIRYRVRSHSDDEAVVDVWGLALGAGPKINGIEESWITGSLTLTWVDLEWKLSGQSSRAGPTPELLRTEDLLTAGEILTEFTEYPASGDV